MTARLNTLFLLAVLAGMASILTAAMVLQYMDGEVPCPLCLLQRIAYFGVGFTALLGLRHGDSPHVSGLALLAAWLLLVIAARQSLLDIYPRPDHAYVGSAVLGLHMPVWSVVIGLLLLVAYAFKLALLGGAGTLMSGRIGNVLGVYLLLLAAINLVSVVLQCGLGQCHTFGYALL